MMTRSTQRNAVINIMPILRTLGSWYKFVYAGRMIDPAIHTVHHTVDAVQVIDYTILRTLNSDIRHSLPSNSGSQTDRAYLASDIGKSPYTYLSWIKGTVTLLGAIMVYPTKPFCKYQFRYSLRSSTMTGLPICAKATEPSLPPSLIRPSAVWLIKILIHCREYGFPVSGLRYPWAPEIVRTAASDGFSNEFQILITVLLSRFFLLSTFFMLPPGVYSMAESLLPAPDLIFNILKVLLEYFNGYKETNSDYSYLIYLYSLILLTCFTSENSIPEYQNSYLNRFQVEGNTKRSGNVLKVQVPAHDADPFRWNYDLFRRNYNLFRWNYNLFRRNYNLFRWKSMFIPIWRCARPKDHASFLVSYKKNIDKCELISLDRLIKHFCAPTGRRVAPCCESI